MKLTSYECVSVNDRHTQKHSSRNSRHLLFRREEAGNEADLTFYQSKDFSPPPWRSGAPALFFNDLPTRTDKVNYLPRLNDFP